MTLANSDWFGKKECGSEFIGLWGDSSGIFWGGLVVCLFPLYLMNFLAVSWLFSRNFLASWWTFFGLGPLRHLVLHTAIDSCIGPIRNCMSTNKATHFHPNQDLTKKEILCIKLLLVLFWFYGRRYLNSDFASKGEKKIITDIRLFTCVLTFKCT